MQIRKLSILVVMLCAAVLVPSAARTMRDLFYAEPGNLLMQLTESNRRDMIDYFDSGQVVQMENILGDGSKMISADSNYVALNTSDSRTVEMQLVTLGKRDSTIVVIETVSTPALDSRVTFYNTKWEEIDGGTFFKKPQVSDFLKPGTPREVADKIPMELVYIHFDASDHKTLVCKPEIKRFLAKSDYAEFEPWLADSITYSRGDKNLRFRLNKAVK